MTTVALSPTTTDRRRTATPVRDALRWYRELPTPYWQGGAAEKTRTVGYVLASMAAWTGVGIGGAVLVQRMLEGLVSALG